MNDCQIIYRDLTRNFQQSTELEPNWVKTFWQKLFSKCKFLVKWHEIKRTRWILSNTNSRKIIFLPFPNLETLVISSKHVENWTENENLIVYFQKCKQTDANWPARLRTLLFWFWTRARNSNFFRKIRKTV